MNESNGTLLGGGRLVAAEMTPLAELVEAKNRNSLMRLEAQPPLSPSGPNTSPNLPKIGTSLRLR